MSFNPSQAAMFLAEDIDTATTAHANADALAALAMVAGAIISTSSTPREALALFCGAVGHVVSAAQAHA